MLSSGISDIEFASVHRENPSEEVDDHDNNNYYYYEYTRNDGF